MKQKSVSFEVAKAIKEAGYPQRFTLALGWYNKEEKLFDTSIDVPMDEKDDKCFAPTYLDVWLWLWKEKKIKIKPIEGFGTHIQGFDDEIQIGGYSDPEEAIEETIEYLVANNLVK